VRVAPGADARVRPAWFNGCTTLRVLSRGRSRSVARLGAGLSVESGRAAPHFVCSAASSAKCGATAPDFRLVLAGPPGQARAATSGVAAPDFCPPGARRATRPSTCGEVGPWRRPTSARCWPGHRANQVRRGAAECGVMAPDFCHLGARRATRPTTCGGLWCGGAGERLSKRSHPGGVQASQYALPDRAGPRLGGRCRRPCGCRRGG
jgi:hypothetical protein